MRRTVSRIKGLGFILWHARHEFYHVLLGLIWAWFLREMWQELNFRLIALSIIGSLLPDLDHFFYIFGYGNTDAYSKQIKLFLKGREWRILTKFLEIGHKYQTNLVTHNIYFMMLLLILSFASFFYDWKTGVVLFGSMLTHYIFDIFDDIMMLGYVNANWKRWRRPKNQNTPTVSSVEDKRIHRQLHR